MTPAARHVRAALLFLVCGIVLFFFDPATTGLYPPCLFKTFLGVQCPGCGSLRAMHQLLHGNVAAAWALNNWSSSRCHWRLRRPSLLFQEDLLLLRDERRARHGLVQCPLRTARFRASVREITLLRLARPCISPVVRGETARGRKRGRS
jgi:hypothetical protein